MRNNALATFALSIVPGCQADSVTTERFVVDSADKVVEGIARTYAPQPAAVESATWSALKALYL